MPFIVLLVFILAGLCTGQTVAEEGVRRFQDNEQNQILMQQSMFDLEPELVLITQRSNALCAVNRTYSEMFCQIGGFPVNEHEEKQIKAIMTKFEQLNDDRIFEDFYNAKIDKRIALTISRVIKQFFKENFCVIVAKVMRSMEKMENDEVKSSIAKITAIVSAVN